jgi:hypothetical protein
MPSHQGNVHGCSMRKSRATGGDLQACDVANGAYSRNSLCNSPNAVDCNGDRVDRLFHGSDAGRRAAADQVAWQQRHVMRDIADELLGADDHIRNGIVLTFKAVENGSHHKFRGVDRQGDDRPPGWVFFARLSRVLDCIACRSNPGAERALHVHRISVAAFRMRGDGHLEQLFPQAVIAPDHGQCR